MSEREFTNEPEARDTAHCAFQCVGCGKSVQVAENIFEKMQLYARCSAHKSSKSGEEEAWDLPLLLRVKERRLDMLCDDCGRCFICLRPLKSGGRERLHTRCRGCGFLFHSDCAVGAAGEEKRRRLSLATNPAGQEEKRLERRRATIFSPGSERENCAQEAEHKEAHRSETKDDLCPSCFFLFSDMMEVGDVLGNDVPFLEKHFSHVLASDPVAKRTRMELRKERSRHLAGGSREAQKIRHVFLGDKELAPLHLSPYPEEYTKSSRLYICKSCLSYFATSFVFGRHSTKCKVRLPPGRLVYHDSENLSIFEVSGIENKTYCQNLCLLSKMFLEHKTLYYDVESFLFYILGFVDPQSLEFSICGYFSKEMYRDAKNNLSCIVVLPCYQGMGLGSLLIDFSYVLSRQEKPPYTAGPEQPLSEQGDKAYMRFWMDSLVLRALGNEPFRPSEAGFLQISNATGIPTPSIASAYERLVAVLGRAPLPADFQSRGREAEKTRRIKPEGVLLKVACGEEDEAADG